MNIRFTSRRARKVIAMNVKNLFSRVAKFLREVRAEMKKVAWPNRKELTAYTVIVVFSVAAVAVFIGAIDFVFSLVLGLIIR